MTSISTMALALTDNSVTSIARLAGIREALCAATALAAHRAVLPGAGAVSIRAAGATRTVPIGTFGSVRTIPVRAIWSYRAIPIRMVRSALTPTFAGTDNAEAAGAGLAGIAQCFEASVALAADRAIVHRAHVRLRLGPQRRVVTSRARR